MNEYEKLDILSLRIKAAGFCYNQKYEIFYRYEHIAKYLLHIFKHVPRPEFCIKDLLQFKVIFNSSSTQKFYLKLIEYLKESKFIDFNSNLLNSDLDSIVVKAGANLIDIIEGNPEDKNKLKNIVFNDILIEKDMELERLRLSNKRLIELFIKLTNK